MVSIVKLDGPAARAAIPALADILVDVVAHGASVNFLAGFSPDEAAAFWSGQMAGIETGSRVLLVAEVEGRIVGTVVVTFAPQPNGPHRAEIGKMLVHSSARRRGLGSRLLQAAEDVVRASGRTLAHLDTQTGSAGEALYRARGWTEMGIMPNHSLTPDGRLASATFFYKQV
ncbi:MAG: GNAT family N-acetyltransferase [Candidatus Kaistia colombiensis]|nr:MAG: GNAT family N-acetyltransferase [Kaistia sp.]